MLSITLLIALTFTGALASESSRDEANRMVETHREENLDPGSLNPADVRDVPSDIGDGRQGVSGGMIAGSTIASGSAAAIILLVLRILYEIYQRRTEIGTALDFFILFLEILVSILKRCRPHHDEPALPMDLPLRAIRPLRDI